MARRKETWIAKRQGVTSSYVSDTVSLVMTLTKDEDRLVVMPMSLEEAENLAASLTRYVERQRSRNAK